MGNYTINGVKNCSKTKGSQRLLLTMIADAIPDTATFRALTTPSLADYCNCTDRYIREMLGKLIPTGELIAIERPGFKTLYAIPILDGEPGYDPQPCDDESHICTKFHTPLTYSRDELNRGMYKKNRSANRNKERNDSSGVDGGTIVPGREEPQFRGEGNDSSGERGTIVPPYPISDPNDQPKNKPSGRRIINWQNKTETAEAERPRSKPATFAQPQPPATDAATPQTPPPPTPAAPSPYGVERFMYWRQVRALIEPRFGLGFLRNYFDNAKLYERGPGDYVIVCRTPMVQEQLLVRARAEIVLQLAAIVRSHVELEIIAEPRTAAVAVPTYVGPSAGGVA